MDMFATLIDRAGQTRLSPRWLLDRGLGLDVAARGAGDEAEIDRIIDSMHATVDTWRDQAPTPSALGQTSSSSR
jgi:hypothetical protein